ncbi:MAG: TraR/DksA C4-type zinc finger protein [Chloroflexota bacterium]|nr:TraR/DksA C4-type zinc finger protein [Chloroflexota bacterium]
MAVTFDKLKMKLQHERERLLKDLDRLKSDESSLSEAVQGGLFGKKGEEASQAYELEKKLALKERLQSSLAEIDHALAKHDEGTYGLCDECKQPIGTDRLEVLPQASLCMNCKERRSKNA